MSLVVNMNYAEAKAVLLQHLELYAAQESLATARKWKLEIADPQWLDAFEAEQVTALYVEQCQAELGKLQVNAVAEPQLTVWVPGTCICMHVIHDDEWPFVEEADEEIVLEDDRFEQPALGWTSVEV